MEASILSTESEEENIVQEEAMLLIFKRFKRRQIELFCRVLEGSLLIYVRAA